MQRERTLGYFMKPWRRGLVEKIMELSMDFLPADIFFFIAGYIEVCLQCEERLGFRKLYIFREF